MVFLDQQKNGTNELKAIYEPNDNQKKAFFLNAPGGCGKTYCYQALMHSVRSRGDACIAVAWTGIAAMLLDGGRTVHNRFKLPINLNETSISSIKANSTEASFIRRTKVILWDEAPMANKYALSAVDRLLRDIALDCDRNKCFGGKVIVLGGDFRQCAPVVPRASRTEIVEQSIIRSPLWHMFHVMELTTNMRATDVESAFAKYLLRIRNGKEPYFTDLGRSIIQLPKSFITEDDLIKKVFDEGFSEEALKRTWNIVILCPKNEHCDIINSMIVESLQDNSKIYFSVDTLMKEDNENMHVPVEFLNSLSPSGLPPH